MWISSGSSLGSLLLLPKVGEWCPQRTVPDKGEQTPVTGELSRSGEYRIHRPISAHWPETADGLVCRVKT